MCPSSSGPSAWHQRPLKGKKMFTKFYSERIKSIRKLVAIAFVALAGTLSLSPAYAWQATRLQYWFGGYSPVWVVECNDGTPLVFFGAGGPDFDYGGCSKHGGIVSSPPTADILREFPVVLFDVGVTDPLFPAANVGLLAYNEILSQEDAIALTGVGDPSAWSNFAVKLGAGFDPAIEYPGVSVIGLSHDVIAEVPEATSVSLLIIGFLAAMAATRGRRPRKLDYQMPIKATLFDVFDSRALSA